MPNRPGHKNSSPTKLTAQKVQDIRALHRQGQTQTALAQRFGVGRTTIHRVVHRQDWKHVQ